MMELISTLGLKRKVEPPTATFGGEKGNGGTPGVIEGQTNEESLVVLGGCWGNPTESYLAAIGSLSALVGTLTKQTTRLRWSGKGGKRGRKREQILH